MTPMTANKIYFGRSHARRWGTIGAVDIFGSGMRRESGDSIHRKDMPREEKCVLFHAINREGVERPKDCSSLRITLKLLRPWGRRRRRAARRGVLVRRAGCNRQIR